MDQAHLTRHLPVIYNELIVNVTGNFRIATRIHYLPMENSTVKEENNKIIEDLFCTARSSGNHWIFLSVINFAFSLTAFVLNTVILVALNKETSLHPPSKLLYRCLAATDLLVGLIAQPSAGLYYTSLTTGHQQTELCFYSAAITTVSFTILTTVSLLTMTAICVRPTSRSVVGVAIQTHCNFETSASVSYFLLDP